MHLSGSICGYGCVRWELQLHWAKKIYPFLLLVSQIMQQVTLLVMQTHVFRTILWTRPVNWSSLKTEANPTCFRKRGMTAWARMFEALGRAVPSSWRYPREEKQLCIKQVSGRKKRTRNKQKHMHRISCNYSCWWNNINTIQGFHICSDLAWELCVHFVWSDLPKGRREC